MCVRVYVCVRHRVITSGSLHDAGSGSLLTSVGTVYQQPATLTHLGPDSGLQHGLGAITQAVPVHLAQVGAAGTRPTIVQSVQGYPVVRLGAQPSVGSSGSKRSGASRRRKAKMYQALNAMVQVGPVASRRTPSSCAWLS